MKKTEKKLQKIDTIKTIIKETSDNFHLVKYLSLIHIQMCIRDRYKMCVHKRALINPLIQHYLTYLCLKIINKIVFLKIHLLEVNKSVLERDKKKRVNKNQLNRKKGQSQDKDMFTAQNIKRKLTLFVFDYILFYSETSRSLRFFYYVCVITLLILNSK